MARQARPTELNFHLDVLVERKAAAEWEAHCLQLDLIAEGATAQIAFNHLLNVIDVQIRTCIDNDNLDNLFFPAPKEVWDRLASAKSAAQGCTYDREIRPLPARVNDFRGMEVDRFCYV